MKLGRVEEGIASVQELFDNQEAWKVNPQFLMQGVLELGLAWVEQAAGRTNGDEAAIDKIATAGTSFSTRTRSSSTSSRSTSSVSGSSTAPQARFRIDQGGSLFAGPALLSPTSDDRGHPHRREPRGGPPAHRSGRALAVPGDPRPARRARKGPDASRCGDAPSRRQLLREDGQPPRPARDLLAPRHQFPGVDRTCAARSCMRRRGFPPPLDYAAAQYFGEIFMKGCPSSTRCGTTSRPSCCSPLHLEGVRGGHPHRELVRERHPAGAQERELADSLYPLALYTTRSTRRPRVPSMST